MRICYVNPTNNIRRPIAELSNILANKGHQITVMYPENKQCPTKNWVANDAIKSGNVTALPIKSWYFAPLRYSFPNIFQLIKESRKILKTHDKIHIWEYYYPISIMPLLLSLGNRKKRNKLTLTTDGFVGYSYKPKKPSWLVPAFKLYTQLIARQLFKIPKKMTTYGSAMIPHAKKAGVPLKKLKVLSTGIHLDKFSKVKKEDVEKLKDEFGITNEQVILYCGMLTERKGIKKVLKISHKLLEEGFNIKTILVGDAHGENEYEKLVHKDNKNNIIFTGNRKDIPEFMQLATLLLLPSDGEGLPGVVMEAMASGLPVVATNEGCTADLIEDGKEGFLPTMNSGREYYEGVKKILSKSELQEDFKEQAKEKIKQFNWVDVAKKYTHLYDE